MASYPSIFYIYGNRTFRDEIFNLVTKYFSTYSELNVSNPNGCGFKIESYDIGDLKSIEIELEPYEGWIQTERRNEFVDLNADLLDLDRYIAGCNKRLSTPYSFWATYRINAGASLVAIRNMNVRANTGEGLEPQYSIAFGDEEIITGLPMGSVLDSNKIIKKKLNGKKIKFTFTECTPVNIIVDYRINAYQDFKLESTTTTNVQGDFSKAVDWDKYEGGAYSVWISQLSGGYGFSGVDSMVITTKGSQFNEEKIKPDYLNIYYSIGSSEPTDTLKLSIYTQIREGDSYYPQKLVFEKQYNDLTGNIYDYQKIPVGHELNRIMIYLTSNKLNGGSTQFGLFDINTTIEE